MSPPNLLFVTLDQFRGDSMSCAGHPVVRTPTLDALAAQGVRFARHYAASAPCAPGRAALYTGMYQMNNRVVGNGTPLDDRFDNIARVARRAGYSPILFGYTDQGVDPRTVTDPNDPRLSDYEGVLPGFDVGLDLTAQDTAWSAWLSDLGYEIHDYETMLATESERPSEHSVSTFLTNHVIEWLADAPSATPWFVHASFIRPHPPFNAPGEFATMYDPGQCPAALPIGENRHMLHDVLLSLPITAAPKDAVGIAQIRAQYYGMISHVDAQLARIIDTIKARGEWENTVVVVTSDHGEQLGDQGLIQKAGYFESSYHIAALIRDPRCATTSGTTVHEFTEAVDIMPTVCECIGVDIPTQCDGLPLTPFLQGATPPWWRSSAHYEWDWRDIFIPATNDIWPWDRRLERNHLTVQRSDTRAYVHFGDGTWKCFDLEADPTWRTEITDAAIVLEEAQAMLNWQTEHLDRNMTGMLLRNGGMGRWPVPHPDLIPSVDAHAEV